MTDRYSQIPISDQTRAGMSLNIDDLGAIGRLLSLQDDVYDEQFEKLFKLLDSQNIAILTIVETLKEVKEEIRAIKGEVDNTKTDVEKLTKRVKKIEIDLIKIKAEIGMKDC